MIIFGPNVKLLDVSLRGLRSEIENEDEHEFVSLGLVRMHSCPWHVTQAGNLMSAARRQRNFEEKSSREPRFAKDQFCTSNSSRIIKTPSSSRMSWKQVKKDEITGIQTKQYFFHQGCRDWRSGFSILFGCFSVYIPLLDSHFSSQFGLLQRA